MWELEGVARMPFRCGLVESKAPSKTLFDRLRCFRYCSQSPVRQAATKRGMERRWGAN